MPVVTETNPESADLDSSVTRDSGEAPLRIRYRIRFKKSGLLRWISHRDLARLWERMLRRAALRLSMTEGFHPKPRVSFPSALALGVEGLDEVVEIELAEEMSPVDLLKRLVSDHQPGLAIASVCRLPDQFGKARLRRSEYVISLPPAISSEVVEKAIHELLARKTVSVERKNKTLTVEIALHVESIELHGDGLLLSLAASESASLRPTDVLDLLGFGDWVERGSLISRVRVVLEKEFECDDESVSAVHGIGDHED